MQLERNEVLTGLLVIGTIGVIAFLLVLLGAPGLFRPLITYGVYFDNAAGIKPGAVVMLAGRKIGQVQKLYSPLTPAEEKQAQQAAAAMHSPEPNASPSPSSRFEARVNVQVDKNAKLYRDAKAQMIQLGLLGDMAIDFTQGTKESGRAKDGDTFAGERTPDLGEAAAKMLEVIKPVAAEATNTMKDLQQTADNLNHLTDQNSELNLALNQFKTFGEHLSDLTASDSALSQSLNNIQKISTSLTDNDNIEMTLRNLRTSSEKLKLVLADLEPVGENIKQFSQTVKTQPWRLIWPTTVKYAEASPTPGIAREGTITVRKTTAKTKPHPRATPTTRTSSR
jgi:ABC-type transporter Mla subunit MlaD